MIQNIELIKIRDNPFNPRSYYNRERIADLASSIKQVGLIQVPQARPATGGFYEIAYGGYRRRAYESLAKKNKKFVEMPLDIKPLTDEEMALFALEENLKRDDMTPLETARAIDIYLTKFTDSTEKELAEKLTMTQGNISNMRRVLRLPAKVLEKVNEGKINFTMARELCLLQGLKPTRGKYGSALSEERQTDEEMMMEAIRGVTGQYGNCTVNGIKKAIYEIIESNFPCLNKRAGYHNEETLFDWRKAGCLKCEKVLKANETQSQVNSFCTDRKCWEKKQQTHKDHAAKEAQARMAKDLADRVLQDHKKIAARDGAIPCGNPATAASPKNIPQEITKVVAPPAAAEALLTKEERKFLEEAQALQVAEDSSQEAINARRRRQQLASSPDHPCLTCANIGKCDGTLVQTNYDATKPGYVYKCEKKVTIAPEKVTVKATVEVPSGLLDKVKDTAGSRAQILDLYQLRIGTYGTELTHGHQLLDNIMSQMDDPQECIEQCTKGFHYAFDSKHPNGTTYYVCTDPKCCSQKKAAFTRGKNARGMLKKKAETEAIKTVVKATSQVLDIPRIEVIFLANLMGAHVSNYYSSGNANKAQDWLIKKIKLNTDKFKNDYGEDKKRKIAQALVKEIDKLPLADMCQLLVEFMFEQLRYDGELGNYQIRTTEALALFHVGVQVPKEAVEPVRNSKTANCSNGTGEEGDEGEESEEDNE